MRKNLMILAQALALLLLGWRLLNERRQRRAATAALAINTNSLLRLDDELFAASIDQAAVYAKLADAREEISELQAEAIDRSAFMRDLLLLNASGYYSAVAFSQDGIFISSKNRVRLSPRPPDEPPPHRWHQN